MQKINVQLSSETAALADQFIELANGLCDEHKSAEVGKALAFAASRFEAFLVSSMSDELEAFQKDRSVGHEYFTRQFHAMLGDNLDEYESKMIESMKYAQFMKEAKENSGD